MATTTNTKGAPKMFDLAWEFKIVSAQGYARLSDRDHRADAEAARLFGTECGWWDNVTPGKVPTDAEALDRLAVLLADEFDARQVWIAIHGSLTHLETLRAKAA